MMLERLVNFAFPVVTFRGKNNVLHPQKDATFQFLASQTPTAEG
ncbi:hypothetical protein SynA1528_02465 [Synechococcus sp. A15-28]|nr:hypothetical protein SynA1528_02465 [Synechococcus sp. A15-28]